MKHPYHNSMIFKWISINSCTILATNNIWNLTYYLPMSKLSQIRCRYSILNLVCKTWLVGQTLPKQNNHSTTMLHNEISLKSSKKLHSSFLGTRAMKVLFKSLRTNPPLLDSSTISQISSSIHSHISLKKLLVKPSGLGLLSFPKLYNAFLTSSFETSTYSLAYCSSVIHF